MSGPEHLPPDDHELEDFLAGRGPHRARYRAAAQEQAPAALDAAVMGQARAAVAVHAAPTVRVQRNLSRWRLPLSLAATLVLGLGVSTRVLRETPVLPTAQVPAGDAPVMAATEAYAPAPTALEETPAVAADAVVAPEATAKALAAESPAQAASAHERMDRELRKAEQRSQPAMAAPAPEVLAAAPPPPPPPAVASEPQAPSPPAPAPAPTPSAAGIAMSDSAAPAPRAELQAKRRAAAAAFAAEPSLVLTGRYRAESGAELELFADGRFTLTLPAAESAAVTLSGLRQREAEGERLLPDTDAALPCALRFELQSAVGSIESLQVRSDCESRYAGIYRQDSVGP